MEPFPFWRHSVFPMVKSRTRKDLKRRLPYKKPNKIELIVCEGSSTEPSYLNGLIRQLQLRAVKIDVISSPDSKPVAVIERALAKKEEMKKLAIPYEKVWCVVDVEIPPHSTLDEAWEKAKEIDRLELILTNPCIEYWFLLHFKQHTEPFANTEDVMAELKAVHPSYKKSRIDFDILYPHTATAIANSRDVLQEKRIGDDLRNHNPSTHMHKIVEHLQNVGRN